MHKEYISAREVAFVNERSREQGYRSLHRIGRFISHVCWFAFRDVWVSGRQRPIITRRRAACSTHAAPLIRVNVRSLEMHLAGAGNLDPIALDLDVATRLEHDEARAHLESQLLRGPERHPGCRQRECAPGLQTGRRSHAHVESTVHRDRLVQIHLEAVGSAHRYLSVRAYRHRLTTTHAKLLTATDGHGLAAFDRDRLCGGRAPRRS